jgi:NAD(P)-dependent dehydrogenase (short-subunit alcohol dehydrogenase family)
LGREIVLAFAAAGADVVIASRKLPACEEVADEVRKTTGRRAVPVACHMGRWNDVDRLVETTYAEVGRVDILVNNAGMAPLYPSLSEMSEDLFDKVVGVNLKGPFRLTALAGQRMAAGDGGAIVNVSSIAAVRPTAGDLPYAAAKAGLNTLTAGFAQAYGPDVRVNGVMAGPFLTDISKAWDVEGFQAHAARRYALGRLGRPEEIVGTVLYLASDLSTFTTGVVFPVDGGVLTSSPFP